MLIYASFTWILGGNCGKVLLISIACSLRFLVYMWDIVESGYELPKILIDGIVQPKVKSLKIEEERKKYLLASKVKWIITNSFTPNKYERISNFSIAKEVWDTLEVAHVRTTHIKVSKIHMLVSQYEMFKIEEGESIKDFM